MSNPTPEQFSPELPSEPGYYLFKRSEQTLPYVVEVYYSCTILVASIGSEQGAPISRQKGLWLRLVPASCVEAAYREGYEDCGNRYSTPRKWSDVDWTESQAYKVAGCPPMNKRLTQGGKDNE